MSSRLRTRPSQTWLVVVALVSLAGAASGCGGGPVDAPAETPGGTTAPADAPDEPPPPPAYEAGLPEVVRAVLAAGFTGDLDGMVARRLIRVGVTYSRSFYFVDQGVQRGASYEMGQAFEDYLNKKLKTRPATKVSVVLLPLPRDLLAATLIEGEIDCVAAQVLVRPVLQAIADFTNPVRTNVSEVVVSGPGVPAIASVDDLSGKEIYARKESSAWQSLVALNDRLLAQGRPPVAIRELPGNLEDEDQLEMVNADLLPMVVVQDYLAEFWKKVFTNITVHDQAAVRTGASLAVAIRKNSPLLAAEFNAFLANHGPGTSFGNMMEKRYLVSTAFVKQATSEAERKKFSELVRLFKKYGDQYRLDYLLMAAQGYQESGLDRDARSQVGAIGVMQVMPATGKELNVGDIKELEANIHAGIKYMRFMIDRYYKDEPMDKLNKGLFAFASYNAGPGRIRQLRKEAAKRGLDPNVWFGNVEQIASERIGWETVTYVANIYKYYIAHQLISHQAAQRDQAKTAGEPDV